MILKRERTGTLYAFAARSGSSSHRCLDREVAHRVAYSKNFCRTARHLRARRETVRFKGAGRRRCCVGFAQTDDRVLAPVYGWFTEGFDMLDLKEAKALLDELVA
jgi:hypothetical protein